jgi:hypothetical protein
MTRRVTVTDSIASSITLSPGETRLISFLAVGQETDTRELAKKYYRTKEMPEYGQIAVANMVRSLAKKTQRGSPFIVKRGKRVGPYPMTVTLERR